RSGNFFEWYAVEKNFHVFDGIDGHATFAYLALGKRVIGIHTDLRGQVEGHRQTRLAFAEKIAITLVGLRGARETRILPHGPKAAAIHRGINPASVREFTGVADGLFRILRS